MPNGTCTISGCTRPQHKRTWCSTHYSRFRRTGTTETLEIRLKTVEERLEAYSDRSGGPDACWPWLRTLNKGYGEVAANGRMRNAYKVAYELYVGRVPKGMELDHLCHSDDGTCWGGEECLHRRCINPSHLEVVDRKENARRMSRKRVGYCRARLHEWVPDNIHTRNDGVLVCKTCYVASYTASNTRRAAARRASKGD